MSSTGTARPTVTVLGRAVAGFAAAAQLSRFVDVTRFERQPDATKRVNRCEAFNEASGRC